MKNKKFVILGSTGSIGKNALDVISKMKNAEVSALAANSNIKELLSQIIKFSPKYVCVYEEKYAKELKKYLPKKVKLLPPSNEGLCEAASLKEADIVLNSLSGAVGFLPLLSSIRAGKKIALANKEPMVMAGKLLMSEAKAKGAEIIPVDSEPSAIFQCLKGYENQNPKDIVKRIFLTASGGAFYGYQGDFSKITPSQALKHPNWKMGKKITVDSATLMNKGLESIEIENLFSLPYEKIEILIHPQSIIHSAVEFNDNSVIAQMSNPDMRLPIQYSLTYPERIKCPVKEINFFDLTKLEFYKPDFKKFKCLKLAKDAQKAGGLSLPILNASNEEAVSAFLREEITFDLIAPVIEKTLSLNSPFKGSYGFEDVVEIDGWSRVKAREIISNMKSGLKTKKLFSKKYSEDK
ncbi:MAG: 1-deoxy-D-xylulose-5-phosphate reductoisomerase [Elusimicrobiota bacterium]